MPDKKSFILYTEDISEDIEELTDEECGELFKAIIAYNKSGELPNFHGALRIVFNHVRRQLERDYESYQAKCDKRSESGKKGGAPKGNTNAKKQIKDDTQNLSAEEISKNNLSLAETTEKQPETTEKQPKSCKNNQKQAKQAKQPDNDNVNVNVNVNDNVNVYDNVVVVENVNDNVVISLPTIGGGVYTVTQKQAEQLQRQYKNIDVLISLTKLAAHIEKHPEQIRPSYDHYIKLWLSGDEKNVQTASTVKNRQIGMNGTPSYDLEEYEKTSMFDD